MKLILTNTHEKHQLYMEYTYVTLHGLEMRKALSLLTEGTREECENIINTLKQYFEVEVQDDTRA